MNETLDLPAVRAYLSELRRLLADSPDRDVIVDGVALHIQDAAADSPNDRDLAQSILDDLGDPALIAADSTHRSHAGPTEVPFLQRQSGALVTVLILAFGGFVVPVAGWIVGLVMLWVSKGWTRLDKAIGTFFIPVALAATYGIGALIWNASSHDSTCTSTGFCPPNVDNFGFPSHTILLAAFPAADLAVVVYLLIRFRAQR